MSIIMGNFKGHVDGYWHYVNGRKVHFKTLVVYKGYRRYEAEVVDGIFKTNYSNKYKVEPMVKYDWWHLNNWVKFSIYKVYLWVKRKL